MHLQQVRICLIYIFNIISTALGLTSEFDPPFQVVTPAAWSLSAGLFYFFLYENIVEGTHKSPVSLQLI